MINHKIMHIITHRKQIFETKNLINYITLTAIFVDFFRYNFSFYYNFRFNNIIFFFILIALFIITRRDNFVKTVSLSSINVIFFLIIIFLAILNVCLEKLSLFSLGKQIFGILMHASLFYLLIVYNKINLKKLFIIYLNIAFLVAVIGIIQESTYVLYCGLGKIFPSCQPIISTILTPFFEITSIPFQGDMPTHYTTIFGFSFLRINSIMVEPFSFCIIMMPAFFAALASFLKNSFKFLSKKKSIVIIVAFFLSFSLVGYFGIFVSFVLLIVKNRRFVLYLFFFLLVLILSYRVIAPFQQRIPYAYNVLIGKKTFYQGDQSTFTWYLNAHVVGDIFKSGEFISGRGLGSHETSYNACVRRNKVKRPKHFNWLLNAQDANSLFLRLLSETGIFGLVVFLAFIKINYINPNKDPTNYLWIINNSILILFIIRLIRQGNYFSEGFFFFIWLYYFSKVLHKETKLKPLLP